MGQCVFLKIIGLVTQKDVCFNKKTPDQRLKLSSWSLVSAAFWLADFEQISLHLLSFTVLINIMKYGKANNKYSSCFTAFLEVEIR